MAVPPAAYLLGAALLAGAAHIAVTPASSRIPPPPPEPSASVSASPSPAPAPSVSTTPDLFPVNCATIPLRSGSLPGVSAEPGFFPDDGVPFVAAGAVSVTRCETPSGRRPTAPPLTITAGVEQFTAVLNALPAVPSTQTCLPVTLPVQVSFVFSYPRTRPLVVVVDPTCSAVTTPDRSRSYTALNPLPVFDSLASATPAPSRSRR